VLKRFDRASSTSTTVRYLLTCYSSLVNLVEGGSTAKNDQIYISALTVAKEAKLSPRDNWGNVRVPRLEALHASDTSHGGSAAASAWPAVPAATLPEQSSLLLGIPVLALLADAVANFTLKTSYMSLLCSAWDTLRGPADWASYPSSVWNLRALRPNDTLRLFRDGLVPGLTMRGGGLATIFFFETDLRPRHDNQTRRIYFALLAVREQSRLKMVRVSVTTCAVLETLVEVVVECSDQLHCAAVRMRRSLTDLRPGRLITLDEAPITTMLFRNLPLVAPGVDKGTTLTMRFLNNITQLIVEGPQRQQYVDPTHLTPSTLSSHLTLILNIFHYAFLVCDVGVMFSRYITTQHHLATASVSRSMRRPERSIR
jgi:hypothetical protein